MIIPLNPSNAQLLRWVGNQISEINIERRELLKIQEDKFMKTRSGINKMNTPIQGSRLFDIGIITIYLKSLESSILDKMEGCE